MYIKNVILNYIFRIAHARAHARTHTHTHKHKHTHTHTHIYIYIYISPVTHVIILNNVVPPNNFLLD